MRRRSCIISFALSTKGARKPKGSKILLAIDRIPLRLCGREFIQTLKRNESVSTLHCTPRARWTNNSSKDVATVADPFGYLKPPRESKARKLSKCWMASASEGRDFKQSSTKKFLLTLLMTLRGKLCWLSLAVLQSAKFAQAGDETAPKRCTTIRNSCGSRVKSPFSH